MPGCYDGRPRGQRKARNTLLSRCGRAPDNYRGPRVLGGITSILVFLLLPSLFLQSCYELNNPADPLAESYQRYHTVSSPAELTAHIPADGEERAITEFVVSKVLGAGAYRFIVSENVDLSGSPVLERSEASNILEVELDLTHQQRYYWRVVVVMDGAETESPIFSFIQGYAPGDTGPAGGIVFHDRGYFADGWRYLEAAPYGWRNGGEDAYQVWLPVYVDGSSVRLGTKTAVGTGAANTELIVPKDLSFDGVSAARTCAELELNGFSDWFLPSRDELDLLFRNKDLPGIGPFGWEDYGTPWYWSSSEHSGGRAWKILFTSGLQDNSSRKTSAGYVRPVRAF